MAVSLQPGMGNSPSRPDRSIIQADDTPRGLLKQVITMESTQRLRALLIVLMACWLTLQSAAVWTMPLRIHPAHPVGAAQAPADANAHHAHETDAAPMPAGASDCDCDHCVVWHLASSGFLLSGETGVTALNGTDVRAPQTLATPPSHITTPPRHPPQSTA